MSVEIENELAPIIMTDDTFWRQVVERLCDNPTRVQPVILKDPESGIEAGKFFTTLVDEGEYKFLQIEFASEVLERAFVSTSQNLLSVQEGIYRIKI